MYYQMGNCGSTTRIDACSGKAIRRTATTYMSLWCSIST